MEFAPCRVVLSSKTFPEVFERQFPLKSARLIRPVEAKGTEFVLSQKLNTPELAMSPPTRRARGPVSAPGDRDAAASSPRLQPAPGDLWD